MAVTRGGIGATVSGTGATLAVSLPTGWTAGQYALLFQETGNSADPAPPSGWAVLASAGVGTANSDVGGTKLVVYHRFLQAGDASPTINRGSGHIVGKIVTYDGVDTTTPATVSTAKTQSPAAATASTNTVPTKTNDSNDIFLGCYAHDRDSSVASTTSNSQFDGILGETSTGVIVTSASAGGGGGLVVMEGDPAALGDSTGDVSHSVDCTSTIWASLMIRLNAVGSMGEPPAPTRKAVRFSSWL